MLVTSYLGWFLFDRRRKLAENLRSGKESKVEFVRDHYLDLIDLQKRLQPKWEKKDLNWNELVTNLNWLMHKHHQGIFDTDNWGLFERYFSAQDVENILIKATFYVGVADPRDCEALFTPYQLPLLKWRELTDSTRPRRCRLDKSEREVHENGRFVSRQRGKESLCIAA